MQVGLNLQNTNKNSFGNIDIKGANELAKILLNSGMVNTRQSSNLIKNIERVSKMRLPKGHTATAEISGIGCRYSTIGKKLKMTFAKPFFMFNCKLANEGIIYETKEKIFISSDYVARGIMKAIKKSIKENLAAMKHYQD